MPAAATFSYLAIEGGVEREGDVRQSRGKRARRARQPLPAPTAEPATSCRSKAASGAAEMPVELPAAGNGPIRVVWGPQDDEFSEEAKALFLGSEWKISATSDRMGYRLEGTVIKHLHGHNIVSDGTVNGSIQVPGNGQPIVLMPDRGTSGGYPKIATVITADFGRFAQTPAGHNLSLQGGRHGRGAGGGEKVLGTAADPARAAARQSKNTDLNIEALE